MMTLQRASCTMHEHWALVHTHGDNQQLSCRSKSLQETSSRITFKLKIWRRGAANRVAGLAL